MSIAIAGNPNVGKTSLFNVLTGSRHKVGNYPGVTVERRVGRLSASFGSADLTFVDLPGTYSLTVASEDEAVAFRELSGVDTAPPSAVLLVIDASNLARNLYLALQVLELGLPVVIALNMADVAERAGLTVDPRALQDALGVPVVPTNARSGDGVDALVKVLARGAAERAPRFVEPGPDDAILEATEAALDSIERARARWLLASAASGQLDIARPSGPERRAIEALPEGDASKAVRPRWTPPLGSMRC